MTDLTIKDLEKYLKEKEMIELRKKTDTKKELNLHDIENKLNNVELLVLQQKIHKRKLSKEEVKKNDKLHTKHN